VAKGDSLADELFNRDTVGWLAAHFADDFDVEGFVTVVMADLPARALKARINHIADVLARFLPPDFKAAAQVIEAALPPPLDPQRCDNDFGHFIYAPLGVYVENHGLRTDFSHSLALLEQITQRFSMEFSVRAFLNHNQDAALAYIRRWATHENYHVRRLASEGTRPRLPWGQNVGLAIADTLPILDELHSDPTRFVTRSVANHLNDIAKTNPDAVIDRLEIWQGAGRQTAKELDWMRRHALRGLMKAGHPRAMLHLGYQPDVKIADATIGIPTKVSRGEKVEVSVSFTPLQDGPLMVDYVIDHMKSNGKTAPKTFKFKGLSGKGDIAVSLAKIHHFNAQASTFRLYRGAHQIHLQVNGRIIASQDFHLS